MIMPIRQSGDQFRTDDDPRFVIGQVVRHRRYGYRGVVVDFDMTCQADDTWFQKNQTQPQRDQPWYHVLVDGSSMTTYAAQTSLLEDDSDEPVVHPLMEMFFKDFLEGYYLRNDEPWPSG